MRSKNWRLVILVLEEEPRSLVTSGAQLLNPKLMRQPVSKEIDDIIEMIPKVVFRSSHGYICAYIHVYLHACTYAHMCFLSHANTHIHTHMKKK